MALTKIQCELSRLPGAGRPHPLLSLLPTLRRNTLEHRATQGLAVRLTGVNLTIPGSSAILMIWRDVITRRSLAVLTISGQLVHPLFMLLYGSRLVNKQSESSELRMSQHA
jgi:hypothetical protein